MIGAGVMFVRWDSDDDQWPDYDTRSLVVLPFASLSSDVEISHLADGLTEDIIDAIAQRPMPSVVSRTSAFRYKGANQDVRLIGSELKVGYILEGSVRPVGENLKITAQLIRAADGFHVWSTQYERTPQALSTARLGVAQDIAQLARIKAITDAGDQYMRAYPGTNDPEAIHYWLRGWEQYVQLRAGEGGSWTVITDMYERAVAIDPNLYVAQYLLANAYRSRAGIDLPVDVARDRAHAALDRAFAVHPRGTDPHALLQLAEVALQLDLDYATAEAALRRLLQLEPEYSFAHLFSARSYLSQGREREAMAALEAARRIDHLHEQAVFLFVWALLESHLGQHAAAYEAWDEALSIERNAHWRSRMLRLMALSLVERGDREQAARLVDEAWTLAGATEPHAFIASYSVTGREPRARELRAQWDPDRAARTEDGRQARMFEGLQNFIALGEHDSAFAWLRKAIDARDLYVIESIRVGRYLDPLRSDPRFAEIISYLESLEALGAAGSGDLSDLALN